MIAYACLTRKLCYIYSCISLLCCFVTCYALPFALFQQQHLPHVEKDANLLAFFPLEDHRERQETYETTADPKTKVATTTAAESLEDMVAFSPALPSAHWRLFNPQEKRYSSKKFCTPRVKGLEHFISFDLICGVMSQVKKSETWQNEFFAIKCIGPVFCLILLYPVFLLLNNLARQEIYQSTGKNKSYYEREFNVFVKDNST